MGLYFALDAFLDFVCKAILAFSPIGAIGFILIRASARRRAPDTAAWPHVRGAIVVSEKIEGNPHIGKPETTKLRYKYIVDGVEHYGSNLWLYDLRSDLQHAYMYYPVGSAVDVYYNPSRHSEAILEPGTGTELFGRGPIGTALFWMSEFVIVLFAIALGYLAFQVITGS